MYRVVVDEYPELPPPWSDECPPEDRDYYRREVLGTVKQTVGLHPTVIEIIRYWWRPSVVGVVGYERCIRLRVKYQNPTGEFFGHESVGVPEADWKALVEAINQVKL